MFGRVGNPTRAYSPAQTPLLGGGLGDPDADGVDMRPAHMRAFPSRPLERLRDESGIALIMAIGIMLVLTIALSTTIYVTSSSARHASSSNAGQKAYALAEAGLNNALAVLNTHYPSTTPYPGDTAPGTFL